MLVAHSMGSHGGQQNFPFGYIPNELHGIGLPDFMTPGPPPAQPLLSEHEAQNLDSFLNGFDAGGGGGGGDSIKDISIQPFQNSIDPGHEWMMPPTFVGSETSLRSRNGVDWQNFQMADFTFASDMNMANINQSQDFQNGLQGQGFSTNGHYDHNLLDQLHNAAQTLQPSFASGWQQNFQPQPMSQVQQTGRPLMRFGTDSQFQPTGYVPPEGPFDHNPAPTLEWLEAHSSATNTQPNTEPNTQPSSPVWSKKRKLDDYQADDRQHGFVLTMNGQRVRNQPSQNNVNSQVKRVSTVKNQSSTPLSRTQMSYQNDNENAIDDEDADYDEEDDPESYTRSTSPSNSSKTKGNQTAKKTARTRKKSTASNTPGKSKSKAARNSISGASNARVPLTADQKKANHTNSEQRRRDATARSYAELYDLVPELEEMGKQSTMKKLEIVVQKVQTVKDQVQRLRATLGLDVETGKALQHGSNRNHLGSNNNRGMGGNIPSDILSWS